LKIAHDHFKLIIDFLDAARQRGRAAMIQGSLFVRPPDEDIGRLRPTGSPFLSAGTKKVLGT